MDAFTLGELLALEHAGWQSLCESRGGSYYSPLMMPEALFILVDGSTNTRDEITDSLDGMPGWDSYDISDATLLPLGSDAAALTYRATSSRADLAEAFTALMSSVYRRVEGQARLSLYQQTSTSV